MIVLINTEWRNRYMSILESLCNKQNKLSVIGLGYVGLPLAVAFSKYFDVVGFDVNKDKLNYYQVGIDVTHEVGDILLQHAAVQFTYNPAELSQAVFHIIAVPTPITRDKRPDLSPVIEASKLLGHYLQPSSIVVYESTVYPGVTEEVCVPILEQTSGLQCGKDFFVGYSPERINPGDKAHRLKNIKKIVSGMNQKTCDEIAAVYEKIILAGVYKVSSIRIAEAAKVVENSQRDINIAFMNELSRAFNYMGIDTNEVVDAMNTKWNALGFRPGLVGGHCIGVDPYYFIYQAEKLGYHSQLIVTGRKINNEMGMFVADVALKKMALAGHVIRDARVAILGITFKENCADTRNTRVLDILSRLKEYGVICFIVDPQADKTQVQLESGVHLVELSELKNINCLIIAVSHQQFFGLSLEQVNQMFNHDLIGKQRIIIDVKGIVNRKEFEDYELWRL